VFAATTDCAEPSFAWYASLGRLDHARSATATFDASAASNGLVLVVVRDAVGGVGWATIPAVVESAMSHHVNRFDSASSSSNVRVSAH
jgi:hypothetical protein